MPSNPYRNALIQARAYCAASAKRQAKIAEGLADAGPVRDLYLALSEMSANDADYIGNVLAMADLETGHAAPEPLTDAETVTEAMNRG